MRSMLNIVMPSAIMPSVIILSVIMLIVSVPSVIMLSAILLSVWRLAYFVRKWSEKRNALKLDILTAIGDSTVVEQMPEYSKVKVQ